MLVPTGVISNDQFVTNNIRGESLYVRIVLGAAFLVALLLHFGQKRRSGGRAVEHPMAVSEMVKSFGLNARVIAILHDSLEDAPTFLKPLAIILIALFGPEVLFSVIALTNWWDNDERYFTELHRKGSQLPIVAIVKLADKLHVVSTPYNRAAEREIVYLQKTLIDFWQLVFDLRVYVGINERGEYSDMLSDLVVTCNNRLSRLLSERK